MTIPAPIVSFLLFATLMTFARPACAARPALIDSLDVSGGVASSDGTQMPFWLRSGRDGRIGSEPGTVAFSRFRMLKRADEEKVLDWNYGIDLTAHSRSSSDLVWTDAYLGARWKELRLTLGRKSEPFGLADSLLTAGHEVYSRNAPTIPKIAVSTSGYIDLVDGLAVTAYLAHGWMGQDQEVKGLYLHQKFIYFRVGGTNPDSGVDLYGGLHDVAWWGGEGNPSGLKDYTRVLLGKTGSTGATANDQINALGDHRGTIEFAIKFKEDWHDWYFYAMSMFEDGSGLRFWKPGDYQIGASWINKYPESAIVRANAELLDTRFDTSSAATEPDNYFNGQYGGWVHEGYGIGTPFVSFTRGAGTAYSAMNRVRALSAGVLLRYSNAINPLLRAAWIRSYGSFNAPLAESQRASTVACALANTSAVAPGWSLTQEFFLDATKSSKSTPGFILSVTKSFF
ncbi:MAG: capsule assembly Wzi family protein [Chlorobiaceae bacterium]